MSSSREGISQDLVRDHINTLIQERSFININRETASIKNLISKKENPSYPDITKSTDPPVNTTISDNYCDEKDSKYQHLLSDFPNHYSSAYTDKLNEEEEESHDPDVLRQKWNQETKEKKCRTTKVKQNTEKVRAFFEDDWRPIFPKCSSIELGPPGDTSHNSDTDE
ncbi:uncharacterized protein LOC106670131 [Cimex lectularius]|uniref:Uncharacterized protein n=1 Tax=Cimex lectularius TaxID=79782 RepID=A0A8I6S219_CIMLE|nr:uncharacterized protein LOC106670131 [Cimex lectularius]